MSLRIPWNEHEEAVLLCNLIRVLEHKIERKAAVSEVSKQLRNLAERQDIAIDDKFRNENGIALQMSKLEYVFTSGKSGLRVDSGWYFSIVEIYKNNKEKYKKLLGGAIEMPLASDEKHKLDFIQWIKKNNQRQARYIIASLIILGKQIHTNILKITNVKELNSILNKVASNKNRRKKSYVDALREYKVYLQEIEKQNKPKALSFREWLREEFEVSEGSIRNYDSAINTADAFARKHNIGYGMLKDTMDYAIVSETAKALFYSDEFVNLNKRHHNRFRAAMRKYLQYVSVCGAKTKGHYPINADQIKPQTSGTKEKADDIDYTPYREIIMKKFPRGFRIDSKLEFKKLRAFWENETGTELVDNDEIIRNRIAHITIKYGDFVYLPEMMASDQTKKKILTYIDECFHNGKTGIYFDALYKEFQLNFDDKCINNPEMLKAYLSSINDGRYFIHKNYLAADACMEINPADEVRDYMVSLGIPITIDNLCEALSHIDAHTVYSIIAGVNSREFIRNHKGEYFHADIIQFTRHETDIITSMIQQAINNKGYMGGKELVDGIKKYLPTVMERYPFLTWLGLRDVIAYKMQDLFSFKGKIISAYGQDLSMADVFANFAESHDHFTLEQLDDLKQELDTPIYFDDVYAHSLRISRENFVSRDQASFDTEATDNAISRFCLGDYVPLNRISFFGSFPEAGFPWNEFLLEHYTADFSKKFKLLHVSFTANMPVGAIVRRNSSYNDFVEIVAAALADSKVMLTRENALQYLVDIGFLTRKNYKMIDQALAKAKMISYRKG